MHVSCAARALLLGTAISAPQLLLLLMLLLQTPPALASSLVLPPTPSSPPLGVTHPLQLLLVLLQLIILPGSPTPPAITRPAAAIASAHLQ
jgi:hypothetical protein